MSLRTRLLLALLGLVAVGLVVAGIATWASLRSFLLSRVDAQLRAARGPVALSLAGADRFPALPAFPGPLPDQSILPPGTYGEMRDASGKVLDHIAFSYGEDALPAPVLPQPLPGTSADDRRATILTARSNRSPRVHYRVLVQPIPGLQRVLVVAVPLAEVQQTLARLLTAEAVVSALVLAGLGTAAWVIVRRDLRPLEAMAATADAIAAGDLSRRVAPAEARTEVGRLGLSLNAMLSQIESAFAQRAASEDRLRRFMADASHELRTPLTSIRGYAEVFERGAKDDPDDLATAMRRIEEESRRMGLMVDDLLLLARLDEGRRPQRAPVDLARIVVDAVGDARAAAADRPIDLAAPAALVVCGDDGQLRQVVANLLSNARCHTPHGSPVRVVLREQGGEAALSVADDGPGLAAEVAERAFEPFFRADASRTRETGGAGLGLAIVKAIVEAHGGQVAVASPPGGGATFTVRLPVAGAGGEDEASGRAPDGGFEEGQD